MASTIAAWPTVALGEVLTPISRPVLVIPTQLYPLLGMHWYAEGLYIKDRKLGAQIQADTLYEVREGDFVYNRLFAWKGSFGVADAEVDGCFVSNEFPCFQADRSRIHPAFLHYYFSQAKVWEFVESQSSGSTPTSRLRLKEPQFLALEIPLPPLDEQRRIVARIEALAARIEQARGLRREALVETEALWQSGLQETLDVGSSVCIGDISQFVTKGATPTTYGHEWQDTGVLFLRSQCVREGFVTLEGSLRITPEADKMLARSRVQPYDVLYNITGASIGRCAMFPPDLGTANINQHIALIRLRDRALPNYVVYSLNNPLVLQHSLNIQAGGAQPLLSLTQVKAIKITLPSKTEQHRIVEHLTGHQEQVAAHKR